MSYFFLFEVFKSGEFQRFILEHKDHFFVCIFAIMLDEWDLVFFLNVNQKIERGITLEYSCLDGFCFLVEIRLDPRLDKSHYKDKDSNKKIENKSTTVDFSKFLLFLSFEAFDAFYFRVV